MHCETGKWKKQTFKRIAPALCSTLSVLKSTTVHNEASLTHARCRPACRALERLRRCGHQGRIFHISNTLDSQTFAYNCFGKTSKKTHTMTFLCLQLYSFVKRKQEVPPQQRLLRAADFFCIRAIWFFFNFLTPAHPHAQSLFLFPIVFGINLSLSDISHRKYLTHNIGSASALPIIQWTDPRIAGCHFEPVYM